MDAIYLTQTSRVVVWGDTMVRVRMRTMLFKQSERHPVAAPKLPAFTQCFAASPIEVTRLVNALPIEP